MSWGLGFAGLGWLGESLLKDLPGFPALRLAAVQDVRADLAAAIAERYASPWQGTDYSQLLAAPGVDVVVICTPNALHVPQAQAALRAGKHVLVQKPLALSCPDAQTTIALATQQQRLLFVDYTYRFLDTVQVLRRSLTHPPKRLRAVFHNIYGPGKEKTWFFEPRLSGGGALVDLGVHLLDLALWLVVVVEPASISLVDVELRGGPPVDTFARLDLRLDEVPFELEVSWNAPLPQTEIAFQVDDLVWENVDGSFFHFRTRLGGRVLIDRETTLRSDTLRALVTALETRTAPPIDVRVYDLLEQALGRRR